MRTWFIALLSALLMAACATIVKGTSQVVVVSTPRVAGAACTLNSPAIGSKTVITPGTVSLEKSKNAITVLCSKECYEDGAGVIASNFEGMSAGNIILGGVIGLTAATGNAMATGLFDCGLTDMQCPAMPCNVEMPYL